MGTMRCTACGGRGIVVGSCGSVYSNGLGAWYPAEIEEPCPDCHGSGDLCCAGCGGTPEVEDLEHGQPWCTECWVRERARGRQAGRGLAPITDSDGCDLPF